MKGLEAQPTEAEMGLLAALADGSLPDSRRAEARALLERSPTLQEPLAQQRRAVERLESLTVAAPASVRERVAGERNLEARRTRRTRAALGGALAGVLAVGVLLGAISLPGGAPAAPTLAAVAGLAKGGAGALPPAPARAEAALLAAAVAGVSFPNYGRALGWRASGLRADELGGRATRTVFYSKGGRRVAYTSCRARLSSPLVGTAWCGAASGDSSCSGPVAIAPWPGPARAIRV